MFRDLVTLYFLTLTGGRSEDKVSFLQRIFKEHGEQVDYHSTTDSLQVAGDLTKMFSTGIAPQWLTDPIPSKDLNFENIKINPEQTQLEQVAPMSAEEIPNLAVEEVEEEKKD